MVRDKESIRNRMLPGKFDHRIAGMKVPPAFPFCQAGSMNVSPRPDPFPPLQFIMVSL